MKKIVFVGVGTLLLVAAVLIAGASAEKTTTITFHDQPADGEIVTVDDHVFEFDSDNTVESGHIPIEIGWTVTETRNNLENAIGEVG